MGAGTVAAIEAIPEGLRYYCKNTYMLVVLNNFMLNLETKLKTIKKLYCIEKI